MAREFTQIAMRAFTLADVFKATFKEPLGGAVPYTVELTTPDGPSTGGGKQALQHIRLIPQSPLNPQGGVTIVAGTANSVDLSIELRSWEYLAALHAQRFRGAAVPLDMNHYRELLKQMQVFFSDQRYTVTLVDPPSSFTPVSLRGVAPAPQSSSSSLALIGAMIALVALGGAAAYYWLRLRGH